jgi:hypothetical protein
MARARRAWSVMKGEVYELLRESEATSYWGASLLLILANQCMDLRAMDCADAHEGWMTDVIQTGLVANQVEYTLPEGTGRVKRVLRVFNPGASNEYEVPLVRNERWSTPAAHGSSLIGTSKVTPQYRLVGELLFLEPPPGQTVANGLKIEIETAPTRLTGDADKIDLAFPDITETLLVYDIWDLCVGVEQAQGNPVNADVVDRLKQFHRKYENRWIQYISTRSFGRTFSEPFYLGD